MSKAPSPLLGYNNNVRHKNRVFHIQTEDSGVKHPHVITHLFMDGGRILKSVKRSYAEHLDSEGLADTVRAMMKEQHKAMFIALRDGQFDHLVDAAMEPPPSRMPPPASAPVPPSSTLPKAAPPPPKEKKPEPAPAPVSAKVEPPPKVRETAELTLDIDALERATAAEKSTSPLGASHDLPPPPPGILQKKTETGRYRSIPTRDTSTPEPASVKKPLPAPVPPPPAKAPALMTPPGIPVSPSGAAPRHPEKAPVPATSGDGRYAPARPAAIFGQARPQQGSSIFGEDLISDKSLDEVILSYLAEDLETEKK
jgi:hypothetical protein